MLGSSRRKGDMLVQAQTYVVRIYRRNGSPGNELAGVVEVVRTGRKLRFESFDQLRTILGVHSFRGKRRWAAGG